MNDRVLQKTIGGIQPHPSGGYFSHGGTKFNTTWYDNGFDKSYGPSVFSLDNLNAATGGSFGSMVSVIGDLISETKFPKEVYVSGGNYILNSKEN